jgi:3-oxoacyl-[acyl-carrier protein] reductase
MTAGNELAVVTGGARGIGYATAQRLGEDGFRVHLLDQEEEALTAAVERLRAQGIAADGDCLDVSDEAAVIAAFARLPRVDALVTCAAIIETVPVLELSVRLFRRTLDVNLTGTFLCMREALRRMKEGGRIVAIASRAVLGSLDLAHYVASKAGVVGLVRAIALETRGRGIAVNVVAPGFVDTEMVRALSAERFAATAAREPRGRPADPSEIAHAIAFLVSPRTSFITGQTLFVDGGKSIGVLGGAL